MEYRIVKMEACHLEEVHNAELECFPEEAWSFKDFDDLLKIDAVKGYILVDSEKNGEIVAYMMAYEVVDEAELINIAVLPKHRRKKLGNYFLNSWLKHLQEIETVAVFLDVRESNTPAIGFYKSFGFELLGIRRNYYSDGEDALVMKLDLESTE